MHENVTPDNKKNFFDLAPPELDALLSEWGWPKFRADQVRDWVYKKLVLDPQRMSNLSASDREKLSQSFSFGSAQITTEQHSNDGTIKLLLTWEDTSSAETVMIPDQGRYTACVSSQVGCPAGCRFCASGINGVKGNLSPGQIVEQIIRLNVILKDKNITNVVFMGMGEPLANYANVMKAIHILHDPKCLNIGARKITVSTVGVPLKMRQLAEEDLPLNLAISLHAPNEALRRQLIPWAEHFSINEILDAARFYFDKTGREITLEYILLAGVNDQPPHAFELARICKTIRSNVNLIRYNEVAGLPFQRPKSDDVMNFQAILRNNNVNAHIRKSRGRDIDAACGQLRRKETENQQLVQLHPNT
jgi:23S rRNA (adenine2503-C2)-methyltransferase